MGENRKIHAHMPEKSATFKVIRMYYKSIMSYSHCPVKELPTSFEAWAGS